MRAKVASPRLACSLNIPASLQMRAMKNGRTTSWLCGGLCLLALTSCSSAQGSGSGLAVDAGAQEGPDAEPSGLGSASPSSPAGPTGPLWASWPEVELVVDGAEESLLARLEPGGRGRVWVTRYPSRFALSLEHETLPVGFPSSGVDADFCQNLAELAGVVEQGGPGAERARVQLRESTEVSLSVRFAPSLSAVTQQALLQAALAMPSAPASPRVENPLTLDHVELGLTWEPQALSRAVGGLEELEQRAVAALAAQPSQVERGQFQLLTGARDWICDLWAGEAGLELSFAGSFGEEPFTGTARLTGLRPAP